MLFGNGTVRAKITQGKTHQIFRNRPLTQSQIVLRRLFGIVSVSELKRNKTTNLRLRMVDLGFNISDRLPHYNKSTNFHLSL